MCFLRFSRTAKPCGRGGRWEGPNSKLHRFRVPGAVGQTRKQDKTERRGNAQKRDPRQRAYWKDALSGSLCFELPKGGRKSSVFNGFWPPRGASGRPRGRGMGRPKKFILFSCRGGRRGREKGGIAFLQYPLIVFYDFGGPRESILRAF